jgi:UDP-N-acetyl-D-glucosamine dehydrogenase
MIVNYKKKLLDKILTKKVKVAVIGLGYVGLPLLNLINLKNFSIWGIDRNIKLTQKLNKIKKIYFNDLKYIQNCDIIVFCLPTPLNKNNNPDLKILKNALKNASQYFKYGQLVVLESTSYPGTTSECTEFLDKNFVVGDNFFISYSPERIDPGNKKYNLVDIPKIISGKTDNCKYILDAFYKKIFKKTYLASSLEVAEMTKIYENVFRSVNIGLVNEIKQISKKLNINFNEVLNLAETKPFGFMKFLPGPGVGGHCIPVDPFYFNWLAKKEGMNSKFIELSGIINKKIPSIIVQEIKKILNKNDKVLCIGLTYKKNIDDLRNSPSLEIFDKLKNYFNKIEYNDNFIPSINTGSFTIRNKKINSFKNYDVVIILTDHDYIDYIDMLKNSKLIIDCRNRLSDKKVINL